jgi:hypothetical protein
MKSASGTNRWRLVLLIPAGLALLLGLWTGLARLGWLWPGWTWPSPGAHGPMMIGGFLGTLIGLERAVALAPLLPPGRWRGWPYLAPLAAGLGGLGLLIAAPRLAWLAGGLLALGSLLLVLIFLVINRMQFDLAHGVTGGGALLWLVGNGLWLAGGSPAGVAHAVPWWIAFLTLTIAGERLELARIVLRGRRARPAFIASAGLLVGGLIASLWIFDLGLRVAGAGLIGLGLWLLNYDLARKTIRQAGLARFIAACLLPGYVWLTITGGLWLVAAPWFLGGPVYDAMLHAVLLGFVFSMIFGHAPIILPAVTKLAVPYRPAFYLHLALLHGALVLRVAGDLLAIQPLRQWGGLLNVLAILLFVGLTVFTVWRGAVQTPDGRPGEAKATSKSG